MEQKEWINTGRAMEVIEQITGRKVTLPTLIAWIEKYYLGHKLAGRWEVDKEALENFLKENRNG